MSIEELKAAFAKPTAHEELTALGVTHVLLHMNLALELDVQATRTRSVPEGQQRLCVPLTCYLNPRRVADSPDSMYSDNEWIACDCNEDTLWEYGMGKPSVEKRVKDRIGTREGQRDLVKLKAAKMYGSVGVVDSVTAPLTLSGQSDYDVTKGRRIGLIV